MHHKYNHISSTHKQTLTKLQKKRQIKTLK